jgi:hypothetical protein
VQLTPKGYFFGDSIAVDGTWKPVVAPVTVTVNIEFSEAANDPTDYASYVKGILDKAYAGLTVDGQPVNFVFNTADRAAGAPPLPCYHQIYIARDPNLRSWTSGLGPGVEDGIWSRYGGSTIPVHEVGHLLGLDDQYNDYFHINSTGANVQMPENGLEGDALRAALPPGISPSDGVLISKPFKGSEHDVMGADRGKVSQTDVNQIAASADEVVTDVPGDVLLNKNLDDQNMVVGAPFSLRIPKGGTAHVDGMIAYCIDLSRHVPGTSGSAGFDPLGPAGSLGTPAMTALQAVVGVIASQEGPPADYVSGGNNVPGANEAIWRITDDADPAFDGDPTTAAQADAILQAAGVDPSVADLTYNAPHFTDPNAASTQTRAVSLSGILPAPAPPIQGVLPLANAARISALIVTTRRPRIGARHATVVLTAQLRVVGAPDTVTVSLTRTLHRHTVTVARGAQQPVPVGQALVSLVARRLKPGAYRLVVRDTAGHRLQAPVQVRSVGRRQAGRQTSRAR